MDVDIKKSGADAVGDLTGGDSKSITFDFHRYFSDNDKLQGVIDNLVALFIEGTVKNKWGTDEVLVRDVIATLHQFIKANIIVLREEGIVPSLFSDEYLHRGIKKRFERAVYLALPKEVPADYSRGEADQVVSRILESEYGSFLSSIDRAYIKDAYQNGTTISDFGFNQWEKGVYGVSNLFDQSEHPIEAMLLIPAGIALCMVCPPAIYVLGGLGVTMGAIRYDMANEVKEDAKKTGDRGSYDLAEVEQYKGITQIGLSVLPMAARFGGVKPVSQPGQGLTLSRNIPTFSKTPVRSSSIPFHANGGPRSSILSTTNYHTSGNLALAEAEALPWFRPYAGLGSLPMEIEAANAPLVAEAGAGITAGGRGAWLTEWMPYMGGILFGIGADGRGYDQILKELREDEKRWEQIIQKRAKIDALRRVNPNHAAIRELERELSQIISGAMGDSQTSGATRASEGNGSTSVVLTQDNKTLKPGDQVKYAQMGGKDQVWTVAYVKREADDANGKIEYVQVTNPLKGGSLDIPPVFFPFVTILQSSDTPKGRKVPMAKLSGPKPALPSPQPSRAPIPRRQSPSPEITDKLAPPPAPVSPGNKSDRSSSSLSGIKQAPKPVIKETDPFYLLPKEGDTRGIPAKELTRLVRGEIGSISLGHTEGWLTTKNIPHVTLTYDRARGVFSLYNHTGPNILIRIGLPSARPEDEGMFGILRKGQAYRFQPTPYDLSFPLGIDMESPRFKLPMSQVQFMPVPPPRKK